MGGSKAQQLAQQKQAHSASMVKARTSASMHPHADLPTGKPGFVSATQIPAGGWTCWDAAKGDFNGDGKPDVATIVWNYDSTTGSSTYSLSVVLGNNDGTFRAPVLTAITDPCAVFAVGDVDRDKKDDIVLVHVGGDCGNTNSTFDVLISNGDGTFTQKNAAPYAISSNWLRGGTLAVTTKSGFLDVVATDFPVDGSTSNVITVLGNGDGTFSTSPVSVSLSQLVDATVMSDLNGDGILDVVGVANTGEVTVFLANEKAYAAGVSYTTPDGYCFAESVGHGAGALNVAVGDLNNDGKPEIVNVCWMDNIAVYVNNGDGSFRQAVYYDAALSGPEGAPGLAYPTAVAIADVNGDGNADVVSSNTQSADVTILLGHGDGTLSVPTMGYAIGGEGNSEDPRVAAIVADFDGDGFADIVVPDCAFSLAFLKGYNDGTFRAAQSYYAPAAKHGSAEAIGLASADFNGDGIPDIVIGSAGDENIAGITVFLSRPDGSLKPGVTYGTSDCYGHVAVADFDKDGHPDIAAPNHCTGELQIFNGKANGTFVPGLAIATDVSNMVPRDLVVGDFDGDGYPDVAVINQNSEAGFSGIAIILNDGTGNFKPAAIYELSAVSYQGLATGDLNGDKKLDIVVPYLSASGVAVLLGVGDGTFTQLPDVALGTPGLDQYCNFTGQLCPQMVTLADVNGDGNTDIITTLLAGGSQDIVILRGSGTTEGVPSFGTPTYLASSLQLNASGRPGPDAIQAVDIDEDGNLDLVYTNSSYGTVGVLYGMGTGEFRDPVEYPTGGWPERLVVADMNNDGAKDLVVTDDAISGVTVLLNAAGSGMTANYTLRVDSDTQTANAGSTAIFNFTITPSNHYDGTITFHCAGLPEKATCTFTPTSIEMNGHTPSTVQLTIATRAPTTIIAALHRSSSITFATILGGMGLLGIVMLGSLPKRQRLLGLMPGIAVLAMMSSLVACGGSGRKNVTTTISGTPPGSYNVTVTAKGTAGSYGGDASNHPITVTLMVQ